jgi:heme/copper-type cytochrome/quinol oxidase subunit 1
VSVAHGDLLEERLVDNSSSLDFMFTLVPVVIGIGFVVAIVVAVINWKKAADAGVNPLTMQTEAMTTFIKSKALAPERSIEERLAELDALHAKGTISAAELATARAEVLRAP